MDLKDLIGLLKLRVRALLVVFVFGVAFTYLIVLSMPVSYKATATLFVRRDSEAQSAAYFNYDGFYSIQTAEKYADSVVGLLKSIDIRKQALERASLRVDSNELKQLEKSVLVKRTGPQLISLTVSSKSPDYAKRVWEAMVDSLIERSETINSFGDSKLSIALVEEAPIVTVAALPKVLVSVTGGLVAAFIGVFYFSLKKYLKN